jgi:hypothetical protein
LSANAASSSAWVVTMRSITPPADPQPDPA